MSDTFGIVLVHSESDITRAEEDYVRIRRGYEQISAEIQLPSIYQERSFNVPLHHPMESVIMKRRLCFGVIGLIGIGRGRWARCIWRRG